MAHEFNGILNNGDTEEKMKLILHFESNLLVRLNLFIDNIKTDVKMGPDRMMIDDTEYNYKIQKTDSETIIAGKQVDNIYQYIAPCLFKPKHFALTNTIVKY